MGKKRKLTLKRQKYGRKHALHPRMRSFEENSNTLDTPPTIEKVKIQEDVAIAPELNKKVATVNIEDKTTTSSEKTVATAVKKTAASTAGENKKEKEASNTLSNKNMAKNKTTITTTKKTTKTVTT
jgi:hypothetical protein